MLFYGKIFVKIFRKVNCNKTYNYIYKSLYKEAILKIYLYRCLRGMFEGILKILLTNEQGISPPSKIINHFECGRLSEQELR